MKPIKHQIDELLREIDDLIGMKLEAESEWKHHSDESIRHRNRAEEAEQRMNDLQDNIEYRLAKITDLEEQENGQIPGADAAESA